MVLKYLLGAIEFCGDISAKLDESSVHEIAILDFKDCNWGQIRALLLENAEKLTLAIQKSYYLCHENSVLGTINNGYEFESCVDFIQVYLNQLFKITVKAAGFVGPHECNANGRLLLGLLNLARLIKALLQNYMQIYSNPLVPREKDTKQYFLNTTPKFSKLVEKFIAISQRQHTNQPRAELVFNTNVKKCSKLYIAAMDIFIDIFLTLDRLNMPQKSPKTHNLDLKSRDSPVPNILKSQSIGSVNAFNTVLLSG